MNLDALCLVIWIVKLKFLCQYYMSWYKIFTSQITHIAIQILLYNITRQTTLEQPAVTVIYSESTIASHRHIEYKWLLCVYFNAEEKLSLIRLPSGDCKSSWSIPPNLQPFLASETNPICWNECYSISIILHIATEQAVEKFCQKYLSNSYKRRLSFAGSLLLPWSTTSSEDAELYKTMSTNDSKNICYNIIKSTVKFAKQSPLKIIQITLCHWPMVTGHFSTLLSSSLVTWNVYLQPLQTVVDLTTNLPDS